MATLKQRLYRKNSTSGEYEAIHLETNASIVLMDDGTTTLSSKISSMDTTIAGKLDVSGTAASATKLATARTIRIDLASTSTASFNGTANITPGVTGILPIANGGTGNSTGVMASASKLATAQTIQTNLASTSAASFDGSSSVTPGVTGTLPITNGGTGNTTGLAASATKLATARTVQTNLASTSTASFNGTANITPGVTGTLAVTNGGTGVTTLADLGNALITAGVVGAPDYNDIPKTVGSICTWGGHTWLIVDIDNYTSGVTYLILNTVYVETVFNTYTSDGNAYKGSILASVAANFESSISSTALDQVISTTVNGVTAKIFVPSYEMVNGGFSYFSSNDNRKAYNYYNGSTDSWFTSSPSNNSGVYFVMSTGYILDANSNSISVGTTGFRPCVGLSSTNYNSV